MWAMEPMGSPAWVTSMVQNLTTLPLGTPPSDFCFHYSHKSVYNIVLGSILCFGALISFVPQHISLLRSRSPAGLSWAWMLLSNCASWALLFNVIGLSFTELGCCSSVAFGGCMAILLPVFQVAVPAVNMIIIFFMYMLFAAKGPPELPPPWLQKVCCGSLQPHPWSRYAFVALCSVLVMLGLVLGLLLKNDGTTKGLAAGFGIISTICTFCMWLPQIWCTYQDKDSGSLSIVMLCIQLPGNLAAVYFQAIMEQESFTTWGSYMCSSIELAVLIYLALYYKRAAKRRRLASGMLANTTDDDRDDDDDSDEQSEIDQLSGAFAHDFVRPRSLSGGKTLISKTL